MAESAEGHEFPLPCDGDGDAWEGPGNDGVLKNAKCGRKALVLIIESRDRDGMGWVESQKNDPNLRYSKESGVG